MAVALKTETQDPPNLKVLRPRVTRTLLVVVCSRGPVILGWGRAISEFVKVDRILAEFLGLSLAGVAGLFGYILREKADDFDDSCDFAAQ